MAENDQSNQPVGYKRPPRATQFKPGQSGNPKGRPKGSKNFATAIQQELQSLVAVSENGRRKKISKCTAIAKQLVNKAASGDPRAIVILLNENRAQEGQNGPRSPLEAISTPADQQVMESIIARIRASQPMAPEAGSIGPGSEAGPATEDTSDEG